MSGNDQLTALDAAFLELEQADDGALMHIGAALVFDPLPGGGTPAIGEVREHLEQRLELLPRYRQKLDAPRTGGLAWPSWERDQRFEIDAHVRHATLPSPGDEPEFLDWISDFYSHRLDRGRPLWEMVLLDGLTGGRWALVSKTHHCLVDGVGSVDVADLLLGAKPAPLEPSAPHVPVSGLAWLGWLQHPPEPVGQVAGAGLAAARAGAHALMHPREALERSRAVIDLLVRDELIAAPHSSLNVPIGATRRIATVHVELQELQKVRSALGGTVNDVVLCAATGALRELLLERGEDPPRQGLRAMVPVNIRREGDRGELGNKVSSLFVELPVAEADPLRRYELVRATAAGAQGRRAGAGRRRGDRADRARAAGAPRGPRAGDVREAAVQCHDHQHPRLAASRVCVRRADGRCRADRPARGRARGRDRRRLLRRRGHVRVLRRSRRYARPRCTQGRPRHVPARACGAGARDSGGTLASGRFASETP